MTIKTKSILNRVYSLLNDDERDRWPETELLEWLNDGQRLIARDTSDASIKRTNLSVDAGSVQDIPADGFRLIDVIKDVATGYDVRHADYDTIVAYNRNWRSATADTAELYFFDERNPKQFELFPPQTGDEQIEIIYTAIPAAATIAGDVTIDDIYADALVDYIAYRGLSKDTEDASPELGRATAFFRAFLIGIGKKDTIDALVEPRRSQDG